MGRSISRPLLRQTLRRRLCRRQGDQRQGLDEARMTAKMERTPDYLELTYSQERAPKTDYPSRLAAHLLEREFKRPGHILDVGCGRGEFLAGFLKLGFTGAGVDSAESAKGFAAGCEIKTLDLESGRFPYPDASFDFVFSKSVVE